MVSLLIQNGLITNPLKPPTNKPINTLKKPIIVCFHSQKPKFQTPFNLIKNLIHPTLKYYLNSNDLPSKIVYFDEKNSIIENKKLVNEVDETEMKEDKRVEKNRSSKQKMLILCGVGYWVQGFRCFPWLALNFHMANNLNFDPSTLQLVQYSSILPMVAKPFYGILFDAINIRGFHRIPYVCIGVLLQVVSWGPLALFPFVGDVLPTLMACVLLSNLGGAITEVAQDALVAEYGQKHKMVGLQSYTFMAIAIAGVVGNLVGGVLLSRTHPRTVLFIFSVLLLLQLLVTLSTKEESLGLSKPASSLVAKQDDTVEKEDSLLSSVKRRFSELFTALSGEKISQPLIWAVGSIAMVPMLTGSIFCFQTQSLNLDPSIIGMSKVIGQMLLLSLTVLYDRFWKNMPFRKLITRVQIFYAASLLIDFVLVKQINLRIGIPNDVYVLCFSGLAETAAIFKTVPFFVLIGSLCPPGCEAPVNAFLASALTLSTIGSGFSGIGLASILGISSENYSNLPFGIVLQFLVALVPLFWINNLPLAFPSFNKEKSKSRSKRIRRNRKKGRITINKFFTYGRGKESEKQS